MAMYVLLSFEGDEDAKAFVQANLDDPIVTIEGIYKKPTLFCDIMDGKHPTKRVTGFTQGQKWGWWVCSVCKKPKRVAFQNLPNEVGGFNLLDRLFPDRQERPLEEEKSV